MTTNDTNAIRELLKEFPAPWSGCEVYTPRVITGKGVGIIIRCEDFPPGQSAKLRAGIIALVTQEAKRIAAEKSESQNPSTDSPKGDGHD